MTRDVALPMRSLRGDLPARVRIREVGPRDGLQNESAIIPAAVKAEFIGRLVAAGLREIEATSFVRPEWVPQLGDASEMIPALPARPDVRYSVLVPNERGLDRLLELNAAGSPDAGPSTDTGADHGAGPGTDHAARRTADPGADHVRDLAADLRADRGAGRTADSHADQVRGRAGGLDADRVRDRAVDPGGDHAGGRTGDPHAGRAADPRADHAGDPHADRGAGPVVAEVAIFASATETFAGRNLNRTVDESLRMFAPVVSGARRAGFTVRSYLSMAFGDPWEGAVPVNQVVDVGVRLFELGCDELSLGDTIGTGTPGHVREMLTAFADAGIPVERIGVHFHDTYGQALANTLAALELGVTVVDASAGGLGGCPYAKSATGNLATEDLVWMLDGLGIESGVDLDALAATSAWMAERLGRPSPSRVVRALQGTGDTNGRGTNGRGTNGRGTNGRGTNE